MSEAEREKVRRRIEEIDTLCCFKPMGVAAEHTLSEAYNDGFLDGQLSALRAQEKNEPLTLEQLSRMSRADWVWVVFPELEREEDMWSRATDMYTFYSHENYGKTWIAYANEPTRAPEKGSDK